MVFPVVMYGCESWTIKKAEHQEIDAFDCGVGEDSYFFFLITHYKIQCMLHNMLHNLLAGIEEHD